MDPYQLWQVLIVAPDVSFGDLDRELQATGFERDREVGGGGLPPIVQGEPELAGWTWRGGKPFVTYTFNPVVNLRVLDVGYVPPVLRGAIAHRVKLVAPPDVRLGLEFPDVRSRLRSLFAAAETDRLDLLERIERMKDDADDTVGKAARDVAGKLRRVVEARVAVLGQLRLLAEGARAFLHRLSERSYVAGLAPRRADLATIVDEDLAEELGDAVMAQWARPPLVGPGDLGRELKITAATGGLLRFPSELSEEFPRGYRDVAPWLKPDRTWLTWTWSDGRGGSGVRYDGLVWVHDRWVWLPKVFRFLGPILERRLGLAPADAH